MTKLRCAVYTRKSSDEGLDQAFNSLDAQREACAAYVTSQKSEGWTLIPTLYDDGGWSGGSMERPALQKLLCDITAGKVDVVVVYKVDRLTRSLADFARIVEAFDARGVSFVSVTQAFNTTSSMGRLTLNVLLSFAQFEREVTGERIRDKIAASKAKGMWMGGTPPFGYDPRDRSLVINDHEAKIVRHIFTRYTELGSVRVLAKELEAQGIRSRQRTSSSGRTTGGTSFGRGPLFHMLRNRIYRGEIVHKDSVYPGLHEAIVDQQLFDTVQHLLDRTQRREAKPRETRAAPLTGLLHDDCGTRLTPVHARGKSGARYAYYVQPGLQTGREITSPTAIRRVPARLIEELVITRLRTLTQQPALTWDTALPLIRRIEIHPQAVLLYLVLPRHSGWRQLLEQGDSWHLDDIGHPVITIPGKLRLRGGRTQLSMPAGAQASRPRHDRTLIAALRRAHAELRNHGIHLRASDGTLEQARGIDDPRLRRIATLAFLAPDIQKAILEGRQPPGLTLADLLGVPRVCAWVTQKTKLGF
jgi:DNA invertase Pin-like site-specific DNA recombinase